ncbi:MAG: hypothetical protein ACUVTB_04510 [Candidatus Bathycorpusculaceae bacterium]
MERFGLNTAKSFVGKNVNLHLKDGSVIVNVCFSEILRGEFGRKPLLSVFHTKSEKSLGYPFKEYCMGGNPKLESYFGLLAETKFYIKLSKILI